MELNIGDFFPDFTLKDENNQDFNLKNDFKNNYLVIYFYPKDETPGCTKQACYFKEFYDEFKVLKCEIVGISSDNYLSHQNFKNNYNLPFKLLCDENSKLKKQLKLPKDFFGMSPPRITFLINNKNEILLIHRSSLNMKSHISLVLKFLNNN